MEVRHARRSRSSLGPGYDRADVGAPTAPRRTRDAERTRRRILDAAEELFARQGFDAASLAAIGEAAGVSRGTPSYFFGSKEELYQAVLERM
jgi:AcrR family transcriptional regulator